MAIGLKYLKLPAMQGTVTSISNSALLDFDLPPSGVYNLSKGYLSVMTNVQTTETDPTIVGIHAVYGYHPNGVPLRNNCYIGDYDLKSDKLGSIDNLQASRVLNCNMDLFTRDFEQCESDDYKQIALYKDPTCNNEYSYLYSMFRQLKQADASRELPFEMKIPLNSFSSFCNTELYDADKMGKLRTRVQFLSDLILFAETVPYKYPYNTIVCAAHGADPDQIVVTAALWADEDNELNATKLAVNDVVFLSTSVTFGMRTVTGVELEGTAVNITLNGAAIAQSDNVRLWKLRNTNGGYLNNFPCSNIDAAVTRSYIIMNQPIDTMRSLIGRPVIVRGTNVAQVQTVITDVSYIDPYLKGNADNVKVFFANNIVAAGDSADTIMYILDADLPNPTFMDIVNNTGAAANYNTITAAATTVDKLFLWEHQKVVVTYNDDAQYYETEALVESVVNAGANVSVLFDRNVITGLADGETATRISLYCVPAAAINNPTYYAPNLVVPQLMANNPKLSKLAQKTVFQKFTVEPCNIPTGTLTFSRLFSVAPNVKNVFVMITGDTLQTVYDTSMIESYRWSINNVDKTNRDIVIGSGLETDMRIQTMLNSGKQLRNLNNTFGTFEINIPMCSLPVGQMNTVQLTLNFANALDTPVILYLYKEGIAEI
jgi:hypothetical protein